MLDACLDNLKHGKHNQFSYCLTDIECDRDAIECRRECGNLKQLYCVLNVRRGCIYYAQFNSLTALKCLKKTKGN